MTQASRSFYKSVFLSVILWVIAMLLLYVFVRPMMRSAVIDASSSRRRIQDTKIWLEASSSKNVTNLTATPVKPTQKKGHALEEAAKPPTTPAHRTECDCDEDDYHTLSMDGFKNTFAKHNITQLGFSDPNYIKDKFTVVIMSYERDNAIPVLLSHFCKAPDVHKILFVWHNIGRAVPHRLFNISCRVPYEFVYPRDNVLSHRFQPFDQIETQAILSIDDDSYLKPEMLNAGFEAWKAHPHLMVGFLSRTHSIRKGRYRYRDDFQCYSVVLTGVVFLHRKYLKMYFSPEVDKLREFVNTQMNGEDIVMNGIVSSYLTHSGIDLTPSCHGILIQGDRMQIPIRGAGYGGLYRRPNHQENRDNCLELLEDFFGELPLTCCHYQIERPIA